jgi:hypothetical protein
MKDNPITARFLGPRGKNATGTICDREGWWVPICCRDGRIEQESILQVVPLSPVQVVKAGDKFPPCPNHPKVIGTEWVMIAVIERK